MRKERKLSHVVQSVVLILVFTMLLGTAGMAANISDHPWGKDENGNAHYFQAGVTGFTSNVRIKEDYSSTYIYMNDGTLPLIRCVIMGTNSNSVHDGINCTGPSMNAPYSYVAPVKYANYDARFFENTVREHKLNYSYLRIYSNTNGTAMGVWSPDSVY